MKIKKKLTSYNGSLNKHCWNEEFDRKCVLRATYILWVTKRSRIDNYKKNNSKLLCCVIMGGYFGPRCELSARFGSMNKPFRQACLSLLMSKYHIVGNHMPWLIYKCKE